MSTRRLCLSGVVYKAKSKNCRSTFMRFLAFICIGSLVLMLNQEVINFGFGGFSGIIKGTANSQLKKENSRRLFKRGPKKIPEFDLTRENITLWPDDPHCSKYVTHFGKDLEPTLLVSFPRSGNTWTRYLIEASTGIFSGSVYKDSRIENMGFHGEFEPHTNRSLIVTKTHTHLFSDTPVLSLQGKARVILLIRNPAEGIPSYFSLKRMTAAKNDKAHLLSIDEEMYKTKDFRKFIREVLPKWSQIVEPILVWTKHLLVLFYEDLLNDPMTQVRRVLDFLKVPEDQGRMECLANHINGPAKRDHKQTDRLTFVEKKYVAHALINALGLLKLRNIKPPQAYKDWIVPLDPQINPQLAE